MKIKYFVFALFSAALLIWAAVFTYPEEDLHLIFCDVGQGDAILAIHGETQVLIDGGPGNKVLSCLSDHMPFWDREIEMVISTHPDNDHLAGLIPVIERYSVTQFVSNSLVVDKAVFWEARKKILEKNIPVYSPKMGDKLKVGQLSFEVFWPGEKQGNELVWEKSDDPQVLGIDVFIGKTNELSVVTKLSYSDFDVLLTGDIEAGQEEEIEDDVGKIEVLKIAHHGSKYSSAQTFLEKISPELAVISVGRNSYGHPTPEVLERLKNLGTAIKRTDLDGEVEVVSDGESWYTRQ